LILAFHQAWHQPASEAHAVNFAGSTRSMCIVLQDLVVSLERTTTLSSAAAADGDDDNANDDARRWRPCSTGWGWMMVHGCNDSLTGEYDSVRSLSVSSLLVDCRAAIQTRAADTSCYW